MLFFYEQNIYVKIRYKMRTDVTVAVTASPVTASPPTPNPQAVTPPKATLSPPTPNQPTVTPPEATLESTGSIDNSGSGYETESMSSTSRALCLKETDTFCHSDTIISVTLTVHLSTCTHYTSNGHTETMETQNAYITRSNNTYYTTYTY